jgi:hypothetical protein
MSPAELLRDHLKGSGTPVIITDAVPRWPAYAKWTFEDMQRAYGADVVLPALGFAGEAQKQTNLSAYLNYIDVPGQGLRGIWMGQDGRPAAVAPEANGAMMYLLSWNAFQRHPELFLDIQPVPAAVPDWTLALAKVPWALSAVEAANRREYWSLYVGAAGTVTTLHRDFADTAAYLAMVRGTKRVILFSPEDSERLYSGRVDPDAPDYARFPRLDEATAYEDVIGPGEMLFVPPNWWHWLRATEKFMTVSHNFFNQANARPHLRAVIRKLARRLIRQRLTRHSP